MQESAIPALTARRESARGWFQWDTRGECDCKLNSMNYSDLCLLADYNYWARDRLLEAVAALTQERPRNIGKTLAALKSPKRERGKFG